MMTDDRLLRPTEVARLLDVHPDTVKEWLRTGGLPGIRLPGGWRVRQSALNAWLAQRATDNVSFSLSSRAALTPEEEREQPEQPAPPVQKPKRAKKPKTDPDKQAE